MTGYNSTVRTLWNILLMAAATYGIAALYLYVFQGRYLYFPYPDIEATPDQLGLAYEPVTLTTADGLKLDGWFLPAPEPRGVLLFLHGNAGNISHRFESLEIFLHLGFSTFIFDYRGYGRSEGRPSEQGTYLDAAAAWRYLTEQRGIAALDIVVFGRSLGGAIAAWLAAQHTPRALIVEASFTSVADMAAQLYPFFPVRLLTRYHYPVLEHLKQVRCPVLVVHSRDDKTVPFQHGTKLFEAANEPKEFLAIRGGHNDSFVVNGEDYVRALDRFLAGQAGARNTQGTR